MKASSHYILSKIKPTLFIALGGTGTEIALRLRRRILSHKWGCNLRLDSLNDFPFAQFINFDLDAGSSVESGKAATMDPLSNLVKFTEEEKLIFKLDMDKYLRSDGELNRYPHIASWFPLTRKKALSLGIDPSKGAGQIRALSRLYFYDKYASLKAMMEDKIRALLAGVTNKDKTERLGLELEPASLRVVVITSTAGGTGSGSFLDMGFLAKYLAKKQLMGAKVDLCIMLPSGYAGHGKSRTEANTYAGLMELETCMAQGIKFVKRWKDGEDPELPSRPYDEVFLFDTGNLALKKTSKATDLFDMVADILFEDFAFPCIAERRNALRTAHQRYMYDAFYLPVEVAKYGDMKIPFSKFYSSSGRSFIDVKMLQNHDEHSIEKDNNISLMNLLEEMTAKERRSLFQNCLEKAMPWVDADVQGTWTVGGDQYFCIIGVGGAGEFEKRFLDEFRSVTPVMARMTPHQLRFIETGKPDKLICYIELNGIPLTALRKLPELRASYHYVENEQPAHLPCHIHKNRSLFVHPLALSTAELDRLAEHFKIFIQGIILGVLKPRKNEFEHLIYCFSVADEELSIGNERIIRMEGIMPEHLAYLQQKVSGVLDQLNSAAQYAGLAVVYDFYARYVYPPAKIRDENMVEVFASSFANVMCSILRDEAKTALEKKSALTGDDARDLIARLKGEEEPDKWENNEALNLWTVGIEGSEMDVYENEIGKQHLPKRILKPEFFQAGWLENLVYIGDKHQRAATQVNSSDCPPPFPSQLKVYVAVNHKQTGPYDVSGLQQMIQAGQLTENSLVWKKGMPRWLPAKQVEDIEHLLNPPSLEAVPHLRINLATETSDDHIQTERYSKNNKKIYT